MSAWLLLSYKIPREPTAQRVYIWRKLRRLEAHLVDGAVWVLPATPRTREEFQWLAAEIVELGGKASLWEARSLYPGQDATLVNQFQAQVDKAYDRILAELEQERVDLQILALRYRQIKSKDYFESTLGHQVREALLSARRRAKE